MPVFINVISRSYTKLNFIKIFILAFIFSFAGSVQALDYGTLDPRALAMGGTTLAIGNTAQAQFYNPALLSFHDGDEDKTQDGRIYFPTLVVQVTDSAESAFNAVDDELDKVLSDAVANFNNQAGATTAAGVSSGAKDLRTVLDDIANKDVAVDAFIGVAISEPSDREGGAFYMAARVIGVGASSVTDSDLNLLDDYINAMDEIAAGASLVEVAARYPNLIDTDGSLIDPTPSLTSSADISALAIREWGVAFAKEFNLWGQAISFGATPKMMILDAYRDDADFTNSTISSLDEGVNQFSDTKNSYFSFNMDLGIAAIIAEHYRIGVAVKDVVARDFNTKQGTDPVTSLPLPDLAVKLRPRSRMGVGYVNERLSIGLDYDLQESTPMAMEAPSQDLTIGGEYLLFRNVALRLGYRQDQTGIRANAISYGIGYRWHRFMMDFAYSRSSDKQAGGLQMGWAF